MSEYGSSKTESAESISCAFFGEGVTFKGSITAPERIVVHGTVEGDLAARDLLVGPTGTIKGNVRVDLADVQGKILQNIEARVCLSLRKTGRIEGSAVYGEIEIEKGGVLSGEVSSIKGSEKGGEAKRTDQAQRVSSPPIAFDAIRTVAGSDKRDESDKIAAKK
jgi:cytoskeletal protein CcmA (bactofilin family)